DSAGPVDDERYHVAHPKESDVMPGQYVPFRQLSHWDIEIAPDQRAKEYEHRTAGAKADAHVGITQGSDLKQHNQKDENSHQDGKERERERQIMWLVDVHRKSSAAPALKGAPVSFACFLRGHDRFFSKFYLSLQRCAALIVAPDGAFRFLMVDYEGYDMAHRFTQFGVTAFVLNYRL